MQRLSQYYKGTTSKSAVISIVLTLAVNVVLFAVLAWVNKRDVAPEPDEPAVIARRTYTMPKPPESRRELKKNRRERKKMVRKTEPVPARIRAKRPTPRPPTPIMPTIRASIPNMTLNLQSNLALPVGAETRLGNGAPEVGGGDQNIASNDGVDKPARPTFTPRPKYPLSAKRLGHEGSAVVRLIITAEGSAKDAAIARTSGHRDLDKSALSAIQRWRFAPAEDDGETVPVIGKITITFELDE